jgi:propane monooxygenase coupling protein
VTSARTSFKTAESPYKADNTASGKAGVTLMNSQVGVVVADVMNRQENVTVTYLPSMIRVDCVGRMDFVYAEISEALGEEEGFYTAAEFEENMSTHYGKMIHMDDRTVMFGNLEEAAEFIGDMLPPEVAKQARVQRRSRWA